MATIDLRDPANVREFEEINARVSVPSRRNNWGRPQRSRAEALTVIVEAVTAAGQPVTRGQIARAVDRANSPQFKSLLLELVAGGQLRESIRINARRIAEYIYTLGEA